MRTLALLALLLAEGSARADVAWLRINSFWSLSTDPTIPSSCDHLGSQYRSFYLAMEISGLSPKRAALHLWKEPLPFPSDESLELNKEEIKNITLYQDPNGGYWVDQWDVGEPILLWMRVAATAFFFAKQALHWAEPTPILLKFNTDLVGEVYTKSYSQCVSLTGTLGKDHTPYRAHLRLLQAQLDPRR